MPTREEAKALLAAIPTDSLVGLRDRALIGTLLFSFARVSAALAMRVEDYYPIGKRWWLRLHEKGGKHHEMPAHHTLQDVSRRLYRGGRHRRATAKGRCSARPQGAPDGSPTKPCAAPTSTG